MSPSSACCSAHLVVLWPSMDTNGRGGLCCSISKTFINVQPQATSAGVPQATQRTQPIALEARNLCLFEASLLPEVVKTTSTPAEHL